MVKNRVSGHDESGSLNEAHYALTSGEDDILDLFFDPKTIESAM